MSSPLSSVKIKPEQPKRAFFRKILRRRHSQSLMNTSLSTAESDDTKLSHSVDSTSNVRGPHDSLSQTYIDNCLLLYDHEGDNLDIMLNPDPDIFSASESMAVNDKSFHTPNSPLFQENETTELTAPWANLTYEALEQPKYFKPLRKGKKSPKILNNIFLAQELRCSVTESSDTESEIERPLLKEPKGSSHTQTLASMNRTKSWSCNSPATESILR